MQFEPGGHKTINAVSDEMGNQILKRGRPEFCVKQPYQPYVENDSYGREPAYQGTLIELSLGVVSRYDGSLKSILVTA